MKKLVFALSYLATVSLHGQTNVFEEITIDSKYKNPRTYSTEQGIHYNPEQFLTHPDFGKLTFDAPYGKNVAEDISKRTSDSRYYVDLDNPLYFYIQKSSGAINTYKDGYWRAIDATLHQVNNGLYESGVQPCPTKLDLANKRSGFQLGSEFFEFNNYTLTVINNDNSSSNFTANWSQIVVANNGAYIPEVFPGIDMRLQYFEGKIKSEFIITQNLHVKQLVFSDQLSVPAYLNGFIANLPDVNFGPVIFENSQTGEAELKIDPARCHDASDNRTSWVNPYHLNGNVLQIVCDSAQLNDPSKVYPLTIDPLVTVIGPIASANNLMGSLPSPAFCSNTINVNFPGGTTPWDVSVGWSIVTNYCYLTSVFFYDNCWRSEAQVWITSSCGGISPVGAPGTIWTCAGCNNYGTWNPVLPFANSGTQSLAQCYSPSCSNQTLNFTINSNRSYCAGNGTYDNCNWATNYCNYMNNWSVTVQGRSAETLGNTATGNGTQTIAAVSCASGTQTLNPAALYGVPNYTYSWNTGATSSTITVPNGPSTFTATVTDACGTVRTATFTITCPLSIELSDFVTEARANEVLLTWSTHSEKNHAYFDVLRAGTDLNFKAIGRVIGHGNSTEKIEYHLLDAEPLSGISYYQLASVNTSGETQLSDVRVVERKMTLVRSLAVIPNPNNGSFSLQVRIPESSTYLVELIGSDGRIYYQDEKNLEIGVHNIPITDIHLGKGTYLVRVRAGKNEFQEKMVVE